MGGPDKLFSCLLAVSGAGADGMSLWSIRLSRRCFPAKSPGTLSVLPPSVLTVFRTAQQCTKRVYKLHPVSPSFVILSALQPAFVPYSIHKRLRLLQAVLRSPAKRPITTEHDAMKPPRVWSFATAAALFRQNARSQGWVLVISRPAGHLPCCPVLHPTLFLFFRCWCWFLSRRARHESRMSMVPEDTESPQRQEPHPRIGALGERNPVVVADVGTVVGCGKLCVIYWF